MQVATRSSHGLEVDVWGLGCMLYTLLVGKPPFDTNGVKSTLTKVVMADYEVSFDNRHHSFFIYVYIFHILNLLSFLSSHMFYVMQYSVLSSSTPYIHIFLGLPFFLSGGFHLNAFFASLSTPIFI